MRAIMRTVLAVALTLWLSPTPQDEPGFVPLFNGRDLTGWVNVNCAPTTWSVRDGMIYSTGKPICELRTTRMFENFVLELEYQHLDPQGNAGVFIWDRSPHHQPFVRAIEVRILDGRHRSTRATASCRSWRAHDARPASTRRVGAQPPNRAPRAARQRMESLPHHRQQLHQAGRQQQGRLRRMRHHAEEGLHPPRVGGRACSIATCG
jgi:hypothetical protein